MIIIMQVILGRRMYSCDEVLPQQKECLDFFQGQPGHDPP